MESALYLIPVTLGETEHSRVLPAYNKEVIEGIRHFIVENKKSAIRFLVKVSKEIPIDDLNFYELNEHTLAKDTISYLDPLKKQGLPIGIISEAGCPAVADPGALVVEMAQKQDLKVIPLVGPSSMILALMASGFNGQSFAFNGYLPVKENERAKKLRALENKIWNENQTQLFIEAPYRNKKMLETILSVCKQDTKVCIAAGLTCKEEYVKTKSVAEWKKGQIPEINKIPAIFLLYK